ncbi:MULTISPECIES: MFS transporter [Bacillus cereus group]|uniref:MFS transporter n=1 Tax=Bacillus cereus group TaxID=86661 RepID=UPI0007FB328D|nr:MULTISPECIES: MFS transporter [Bacillus cereus group]MCP1397128.1 DHA2 family methylenomycin A resistance protein-like MFS transporter [Bacillus cereus]MEC2256784.1 MFS transporter [Bacillus cereus]MED2915078.1 MFS transporter [Bacillus thuringiensis]MED2922100.1 MFS transporter [Bacillus thuringiensis]MED3050370.1 MFS transporter [Bacillus thuringiensis]
MGGVASRNSDVQTKEKSGIIILIALAIGFIMATLDVTVVNVAVVNIQETLGLALYSSTWIVDGYILSFAALLLAGGSLANRFGAKKIYMIGLIIFVFASLLCAIATTGNILVMGRVIQGVGAALFMPSSLSLLVVSFPDEKKRAKMFGIWSAIVSIASGTGPFIGGLLVNTFGWRSIFIINLPIGMIGIVVAFVIIPNVLPEKEKINVANHLIGIIAITLLAFTLIEGPSYGWSSSQILGGIVGTVLTAILFVYAERKSKNSVVPRVLFQNETFTSANIVGFLINFALFGGIFMFGLFLQKAYGASPFVAGLQLLPMMSVFVIGNLLFAKMVTKFGSNLLLFIALFIASIGSVLLMFLVKNVSYIGIALIYSVVNLGIGIAVPAMTTIVMKSAGRENGNMAGATLNVNRQIGALVGIAIMGIILNESSNWYRGASYSFLAIGLSYLCAAFLVWKFVERE